MDLCRYFEFIEQQNALATLNKLLFLNLLKKKNISISSLTNYIENRLSLPPEAARQRIFIKATGFDVNSEEEWNIIKIQHFLVN